MATNMIGTCRSPHAGPGANGSDATRSHEKRRNDTVITAKAKKKSKKSASEESLVAYFCAQICEHQLGISINLLLLLALTHIFFPRARRRTTTFFSLSYYNSQTDQYGCGTDDLPYVALWLVIFTGLRVAVMEYILEPIAKLCGIKTKKGLERFKEQAWLVCYCVCSWSLGMYITYNSEFWFNVHGLWRGWPFREISGLHKFYYLFQSAFWLQQILVVNIEERRKDYHEMFTHHIFTCALLFLSYGYYHTRVGIVILCLMDLIDIVLPTAKLLKYAGYSNLCDVFFGLFVVTWLVTRQVLFPIVLWSIYKHTPTDMQPGCYFPDGRVVPSNETTEYESLGGNLVWSNLVKSYTDREGPVCWNPTIRYSFLTLLTALQVLILLWFAMIIKVVYKVLSGKGADDVRSDDEDEEEDEDEKVEEELERVVNHPINAAKAGVEWAPVEQEVGVEALTFSKRRERSSRSSGSSRASGISIPGHADRKELLGRIGCDKPT